MNASIMSKHVLHAKEWHIDDSLVRTLLLEQCPIWAHLRLQRLRHSGTDNIIYRLGNEFLIRLPRTPESALRTQKEHLWLPVIGDKLPLCIPVPLFMGVASSRFPGPWTIQPWFQGQTADQLALDEATVADQLAQWLCALQQLPTSEELLPGPHNFYRGTPLYERDDEVQAALRQLKSLIDTTMVSKAWKVLRDTPPWPYPPTFIHGDLLPNNILVMAKRITAILDFGGLGIGDPACDLIPAWRLLSTRGRIRFQQQLKCDQNTWLRGQGWALSIGLIALPYYRYTLPDFAKLAEYMIREVMQNFQDQH